MSPQFIATKPKIIVGLPTGRHVKDGKVPKRLMVLLEKFAQLVPTHEVNVAVVNNEREAHAVNLLIEQFRNDPGAEWFVWLSENVEISPQQLLQLVGSGKGVCGALTTTCKEPAEWLASFFPDLPADEHGILCVAELGAGAKVYHRTVFDVIEKDNPDLTYIYDGSGRAVAAFCQERLETFLDYRRMLSPAYYLDFLCRKANIGVFAHTGVIVKTRGADGRHYPKQEPYKPWLYRRLDPPVIAEELPDVPVDSRPIRVCLQYCDKDTVQAHKLAEWLWEQSEIAVDMIYSPGDKYPKGPNETAVQLLRQDFTGFKAVLLLEPDCTPLTRDWLQQLSRDWDRCAAAGKLIMGSWHPVNSDHPTMGHLNGNLLFSPELRDHVLIPDVPPTKPWDTYLAEVFQPFWARTGLIKNLNRHKTATTRQLTEPECGTRPPVLVHGVKDDSAWNLCATNCSSPAIAKTSSG